MTERKCHNHVTDCLNNRQIQDYTIGCSYKEITVLGIINMFLIESQSYSILVNNLVTFIDSEESFE